MADLHFHHTSAKGKQGKEKNDLSGMANLIFFNLVMAEMDSKAVYGPCLVVLLTSRAKSRVTGSALGQRGQSWKDGEFRLGVRPTKQGEAREAGCR